MISRKLSALLICAFGSALLLLSLTANGGQSSPLLELSVDNPVATAGFYRLGWAWQTGTAEQTPDFQLQEANDRVFVHPVPLYRGPDLATVISGRSDGVRYYRIRALSGDGTPSEWSNVVKVETQHHPLSRALGFFAVGAIIFTITLLLILKGNPPEWPA